ncbi:MULTISPECIES: hypothetical protein [unclassified Mesorhizobium]|uniref:hypothetical protein n=1 Tax=unclassified Mesorhizobium TaxID=325217 RepID=UPI000FCCAD2A|nr:MULTISPECIES: hypothetical protein [unclassified Mesorhizobium]TGP22394.1 hypothetical protein EN874_020035 [Mesorhizobium sp. M1D.F.Ca.ET.231.01.1.1]TGP25962.1 hypothetical protein EN877_27200 [Mesorhizobium sp. M1D.F.Ca.ET.234.01.1.1]TGS40030.1 hypothetical protein EN827_27310 [Mesorhizobium sp. M1D.F.Ca.ET.184.01.1.1]TGS58803.1 hypothetical protein EN826_027310 [Mesorhizobium sp. M1D.F.Ca.ET.183.01.1.1]
MFANKTGQADGNFQRMPCRTGADFSQQPATCTCSQRDHVRARTDAAVHAGVSAEGGRDALGDSTMGTCCLLRKAVIAGDFH